jgi:large subunit ribosomal protein L22
MLKFTPSRAARVLEKVLNSAVANAENNLELDRDELVVARAYVDKGPSMKRMTPRARGRADILTKRSSHVTVIVADRGK